MTTTNDTLAALFTSMAEHLKANGANPHRVRAYRRAADATLSLQESIEDIAQRGELQNIPGIGKELSAKIQEFLATGKVRAYEELTTPLPPEIAAWTTLPGFSEPLVQDLYFRLGIRTLSDLETLVRSHLIRTLPGFSGSTEDLLVAIQTQQEGVEEN